MDTMHVTVPAELAQFGFVDGVKPIAWCEMTVDPCISCTDIDCVDAEMYVERRTDADDVRCGIVIESANVPPSFDEADDVRGVVTLPPLHAEMNPIATIAGSANVRPMTCNVMPFNTPFIDDSRIAERCRFASR
jgi:hypothetical protein